MNNSDRNIIKGKILKCLTLDFKNNQAIFNKDEGSQVFNGTDLDMVMEKVVKGLEFAKTEINSYKNARNTFLYKSNDEDFTYYDLENCPFCGTKPEIHFKGNNHTKKREVKIKCKKCRVQLINAGLRLDSKELAKLSIDAWNSRCA